jgi:uncharacterized repeat protein (TIGR02543 family)
MKTILSLRKHHNLKIISIFLIVVALIVGTVGCEAGGEEVGPLDHFKWYLADGVEPIGEVVYLEDQFGALNATVGWAVGFGNPAEKVHGEVTTPISNPDHHLTGYEITYEEEPQEWFVKVENQFGLQELTVWGPFGLVVPTQKEGHQPPVGLDHYLVYQVVDGPSVDVSVYLQDEFDDEPQESLVGLPMYFANPVRKTHGSEVTEILNPEDHLVFYYIDADFEGEVEVVNQFGEQTLDVYSLFGLGGLAVPSEKIDYWQDLVYDLTMAVNPAGGGTAPDLTGASPYAAGTGVSIQAVANPGYKFVSWTAPAGAFTDANAAETIFTMPAQDVTVTAHFVGPLDHFKWYLAEGVEPIDQVVYLEDQFGAFSATVGYAAGFGNPTDKQHGQNEIPIWNPDHHLTAYEITYNEEPQTWFVKIQNQFGIQELTVYGPIALLLPTQKEGHQPPVNLDHFLLYEVIEGEPVEKVVSLQDQFDDEPQESLVDWPMYFANPVQKTYKGDVTEILNPEAHLAFYAINASFSGEVEVVNQFGEQTIDVYTLLGFGGLAVPSEKIESHQLFQEATGYAVTGGSQYIGESVYLEDRFGAFNATVTYTIIFFDPVEKWHDGMVTPIRYPDMNYLVNNITCEGEPGEWLVVVENQFGVQSLTVSGPTQLSTPAQKLEPYYHDPPVEADHLLDYQVIAGDPVNQTVDLYDEFGDFTEVLVLQPNGFGNPTRKIHDGNVTEIVTRGDWCYVTYILSLEYLPIQVKAVDQFGQQTLDMLGPVIISVQSQILHYERIS